MVKIWDWQAASSLEEVGSSPEEVEGHSEWIQSVAISPNNNLFVTVSWDRSLVMWDLDTGRMVRMRKASHSRPVVAVAFAPDGRSFASAGGEIDVNLWDSTTGELKRTLLYPNSQARELSTYFDLVFSGALAFSPDGKQIALGTDSNLTIWTLDSGMDECMWQREGQGDLRKYVYSIAFSADQTHVVVGHTDHISLTNLRSGSCTFFQTEGTAHQLMFSDSGTHILSSVGVIAIPGIDLEADDDQNPPKILKRLHLADGWIVDAEGKKHGWVPESYRGNDVHASRGSTLVLGGANGRPTVLELSA